jgi:hypothetical protein
LATDAFTGVFLTGVFLGVAALTGVFFPFADALLSGFLPVALTADFFPGSAGAAAGAAATFFFSPPFAVIYVLPDFLPTAGAASTGTGVVLIAEAFFG